MNQEHERSGRLTDEQKQLIEDHMDFAKKVAFKSNASKSLDYDDVIDLALEALVKAAIRFDPTRENKFTTYAYRVIQNHLVDAVKKYNKEILVDSLHETEPIQSDLESSDMKMNQQRLYEYLIKYQHDREINLLIHRYFADEDKITTQADLTTFYNLSQAQLSHLERKAKDRIRKELVHF